MFKTEQSPKPEMEKEHTSFTRVEVQILMFIKTGLWHLSKK